MDIDNLKSNFLRQFNLQNNGFYNSIFLSDVKVGFSAVRDLDVAIKNKLKISDGKEYRTLFRVYIKDEDLENSLILKKPLIIRAHFNLVENNEFFRENYDFIKNDKYKPLDLTSKDYFYDIGKDIFYDNKNKVVSAADITKKIYSQHIKTSKLFLGFYLRLKIYFWHKLLPNFFKLLSNLTICLLYIISGQKYSFDIIRRYVDITSFKDSVDESKKLENSKESKKITIFDYSASFWSIFVYCLLHLALYTIFYLHNYKPNFINVLLSNNFLVIVYAIFSLSMFEVLIPKGLKALIRKFTLLSVNISMKSLKV